jgi:Zn-dependent peptidase ImmA (M78 family)/transcriptional regulator with XRE-family HTH domain
MVGMTASERIPVAPAVLKWARETAGLTVEQAAKGLQVNPDTVLQWESGSRPPTIKQLRNASKRYGRPLAVLLLPAPAKDFQALRDFRRTDASGDNAPWSPALRAEFRRALSQREVILEIADLSGGGQGLAPGLEPSTPGSAEELGAAIRTALSLDDVPPRVWGHPHEALNLAVDAVERLNILVIRTRGVPVSEMRGFSISEWPVPVIALNGKDWPRPRLFTLLHEVAHLTLNSGGVCDLHEHRGPAAQNDQVEHFCNQAAAAALLPADRVLAHPRVAPLERPHEWPLSDLADLSKTFGASAEATLLRLVALEKATWDTYWARKAELEAEYSRAREAEKERQRESEGGPNYYTVKARDLGHAYVASVLDAFRSRVITSLDVADYLDVRYDQLGKLEGAVR